MMNINQDLYFMDLALIQAQNAYDSQEVPVGAVLIDADGKELASEFNKKEMLFDPTAHAEILCFKNACTTLQNWRLTGCTLYVTLEPCPMCLSAAVQSRLKRIVFGTYDYKGGAISAGMSVHNYATINHTLEITGGIKHLACSKLLSTFFKERRQDWSLYTSV
jgi:tRNA(adenine34) deaminase